MFPDERIIFNIIPSQKMGQNFNIAMPLVMLWVPSSHNRKFVSYDLVVCCQRPAYILSLAEYDLGYRV
jgi:hypothetical protein